MSDDKPTPENERPPNQAKPDQTQPNPTNPEPASPAAAKPEPTKPEPAKPAAAKAEPVGPEPTEPEPELTEPTLIEPELEPLKDAAAEQAAESAPTKPDATAPEPTEPEPASPEPESAQPESEPVKAAAREQAAEGEGPAAPTPMPKAKVKSPNLALRRLRTGFKPSRGQAIVAVVVALVACVAVVQVRVNRADDGYQNARREDLIAILDGLGQNTRRLESEIADLEDRKNSLSSSADKAQTAREQAEAQVRVLGILAGTLPAQGPGVRITLNDPQGKMSSSNLLDAIEELRDAGAEAIQINGTARVVASTDFVDDAPGIRIDGHKVTSPYVVEAIGESHNLAEAANFPGGLVSEVTGPQVGGTAEVTELPLVQINALHAAEEHRYARPAPSPTK